MPILKRAWRMLLLGAFAAALIWVETARPASAAPPVFAGDPAHPSPLEFADGSSYVVSAAGVREHTVCVAFVNRGPRLSTRVTLNLAMVDATGTVIGVDVIQPKGKFPVGERSAFSGGGSAYDAPNGRNGNCEPIRTTQSEPLGSTIQFQADRGFPIRDVAAILVSARKIDYDDSTVWRTDDVPHNGDHVTLSAANAASAVAAAGPPRVAASAQAGSPIEMTDAFEYVSNAISTSGRYTVSMPPVRMECFAFVNRDARAAKHVRFAVALADRSGAIIKTETLDAFGGFGQGAPIIESRGGPHGMGTGNCIALKGRWVADGLSLAAPAPGAAFEVGRVQIEPILVDFADGSSWQGPSIPLSQAPK